MIREINQLTIYFFSKIFSFQRHDIVGIITVRSLLDYGFQNGFNNLDIAKLMIKPYFAPETIRIDKLLNK